MKVRDILEAEKYTDKDGKVVHRISRAAPRPVIAPPPAPPQKEKKAKRPWPDNPFARPSDEVLYGKCNYPAPIRLRKRSEPFDGDYIGNNYGFLSGRDDGKLYSGKKEVGTYKVVGTTYNQHPLTELWHEAQTLVCYFDDGSIVPATRLGPSNVIVQDRRFKGKINFIGNLYDGDEDDLHRT